MVAPMTKREVYEETVKYCDRILEILKDWEPSNDTPPGRVIFECMWLKQEIERNRLPIPFYGDLLTIRYVYTHGDMPGEAYEQGIKILLKRIIKLSKGHRLVYPENYPEVIEAVDELLDMLGSREWEPERHADLLEADLREIRRRLETTEDVLPFSQREFPYFLEHYYYDEGTFDDLPEIHERIVDIDSMVFEGYWPGSEEALQEAARQRA